MPAEIAQILEPSSKAKILVVGLNYAPDFIGIPKYTTELCEELSLRGYTISVVTGPPYYPAWTIPAEYRRGWRHEELNGVNVLRVPIYVPQRPRGITRLLHHLSFAVASLPASLIMAVRHRPDVVLSIAPSLMSVPSALAAGRLARAKTWLHVQDFEIDAAFELGMLRGNKARAFAIRAEKWLLSCFDRVSTISDSMRRLLISKGVDRSVTLELRNWVDINAITPWPSSKTTFRSELSIPETDLVALYSGNMAGKQGLEVLADVASKLDVLKAGVTLVLCGQGPIKEQLEAACSGLSNVRFLDLQPIEKLPELLATADIHLLPQRAEAADLVLPSKLTGMLASGRPVIAMAGPGTGLASEVDGCGIVVPPGDPDRMVEAIIKLKDVELRVALGRAARAKAELVWQRSSVIDGFERCIEQMLA